MSVTPTESTALATEGVNAAGLVGCLLIFAGFGLVAGAWGVVAAAVAVALWVAVGTPAAIAGGHVALAPAPALATSPSLIELAVIEVGFVVLVLASMLRAPRPLGFAVVTLVTGVAMVAVLAGAFAVWPHWAAATILVGAVGVATYLAHRATLVRLGLVEEAGP